jgi:hypothetical protein
MRVCRVVFSGASLLVLLALFGLGTSCGDEKSKVQLIKVSCPPNVDVTLDPANGPMPPDIYVCKGSTVSWNAPQGVNFTVFFKNHKCPFNGGCKKINQDNKTSGTMKDQGPNLTVFDYGVSIDGELFDPHVVGGGG